MKILEILKTLTSDVSSQLIQVERQVSSISHNLERKIQRQVNNIKKEIISTFLMLLFVLFSLVFLLSGTVVLLNKFFPLELVLLIFGFIFVLLTVLIKIIK